MIATIATVCLAASAANPQATSHKEGRQLIGYTQSLGERCDMISYCKSGLTCNNGVFGTGKCVTNSEARQQNRNEAARQGYGRQLIGWTQSLGERCDMISYCKSGLTCNNGVFGTGKCVTNSEARQQNIAGISSSC